MIDKPGRSPQATRLMAPGSCLIISVACYDDEALCKRLPAEDTASTWHNHSRADVEPFLAGMDFAGPGIAEAGTWRPWMPDPCNGAAKATCWLGVARIRP